MPVDVCGIMNHKSTWARRFLNVYSGTVLEAGWCGFLTLELVNHSQKLINIEAGTPIGQVMFYRLERPVEAYSGKYQNQGAEPVAARA